jgi:hypothetical protein
LAVDCCFLIGICHYQCLYALYTGSLSCGSCPGCICFGGVSKRYNFINNRTLKRKRLEYNVLVDWTLLFWHVFAYLSGITKKQDHENLTIQSCDVPEPDKRQTCKTGNIPGVQSFQPADLTGSYYERIERLAMQLLLQGFERSVTDLDQPVFRAIQREYQPQNSRKGDSKQKQCPSAYLSRNTKMIAQ